MKHSVDHSQLVKGHFDQKYKDYDLLIRKLIPKYEEMHRCVLDLAQTEVPYPHILDLGIGSGQTALGLLNKLPTANITGVDFSEQMLSLSRSSLKSYSHQITFVLDDIKNYVIDKHFDLCVGVLSIHHLNEQEKGQLFNKVYENLQKDGIFIIGDIVNFDSINETKEKENLWKEFLWENLGETKGQYWFDNYLEEDIPSSVPTHLKLLKAAGFCKIECVWSHINYAVIRAQK